jgi:hypothetical protein
MRVPLCEFALTWAWLQKTASNRRLLDHLATIILAEQYGDRLDYAMQNRHLDSREKHPFEFGKLATECVYHLG